MIDKEKELRCICGAVGKPKDRGRFLKRHLNCEKKREFSKKLALGVRCVEEDKLEEWKEYD